MRTFLIFFLPVFSYGVVFTSADGQFSIDMPGGWAQAKNIPDDTALSIYKGTSKIEFKYQSDCDKESCLEQKINEDLVAVKAKKMKVLGNSYTGEDVKKVDFATGEPLFYISFSASRTDFSAGYFLINSKAYSVLAQNITYAEADLFFSFISPKANLDKKAYSTYSLPQVEQADLLASMKTFKGPSNTTVKDLPLAEEPVKKPEAPSFADKTKKILKDNKDFSFVSKNMPPFIRQMGRLFDVVILFFIIYFAVFFGSIVIKIFLGGKEPALTVNPASAYPVKFQRLYGTPSLIYKARDNQGNTFLSFTTRWGSAFSFAGIIFIAAAVFFMCVMSFNETFNIIKMHQFHFTTAYSIASLIAIIGMFIFALGVVISLVSLREFTLYNKIGKKSVYVLQKGYGIKKEVYSIYYAHTKDTLTLERRKFYPKRMWKLYDSRGELLASIEEASVIKAVLRKIFGHMWGILRTSYKVDGVLSSSGFIKNHNTVFNAFTANIDKPQAIDTLDMLTAALVINIRDRDSWHPSIN